VSYDCPIGLDKIHCQNCYFWRDEKCDYEQIMEEMNCQEHPAKGTKEQVKESTDQDYRL